MTGNNCAAGFADVGQIVKTKETTYKQGL